LAVTIEDLYERLARAASLEGDDAAIRVRASYVPAGGPSSKVFPATYPHPNGQRGQSTYLFENRYVETGQGDKSGEGDENGQGDSRRVELVPTVLLDSTQSQANRCEEALVPAGLPHLVLDAEAADSTFSITSLEAPHRSRDAYFRDSLLAETKEKFDESEVGSALAAATERTPLAYYRHAPTDLVYGSWDSHRGNRRATRFARAYTSEIIGLRPDIGRRGAGRMDPLVLHAADPVRVNGDPSDWEPTDKAGKGTKKLSEMGHGMIPPSLNMTRGGEETLAGGGVAVAAIERHGVLGFAALARLQLVSTEETPSAEGQRAGRAALAALALLGDRLAFAAPAIFLRSGCELVLQSDRLTWVSRAGEAPLDLDREGARALFDHAVGRATEAGLPWESEPVRLMPADNMQRAIERALTVVELEPAE
jgi:CRISPR-associated protein Csb1